MLLQKWYKKVKQSQTKRKCWLQDQEWMCQTWSWKSTPIIIPVATAIAGWLPAQHLHSYRPAKPYILMTDDLCSCSRWVSECSELVTNKHKRWWKLHERCSLWVHNWKKNIATLATQICKNGDNHDCNDMSAWLCSLNADYAQLLHGSALDVWFGYVMYIALHWPWCSCMLHPVLHFSIAWSFSSYTLKHSKSLVGDVDLIVSHCSPLPAFLSCRNALAVVSLAPWWSPESNTIACTFSQI